MDTICIQEMASRVMRDLGAGYSESIYQRALYNKIVKIDTTAALEKTIQVVYDGEVVGTCRADIVTAHHVIEIKAVRIMPSKVENQIRKYVKNLYDADAMVREGVVINFNQELERVDFLTFDPQEHLQPSDYRRRKITALLPT